MGPEARWELFEGTGGAGVTGHTVGLLTGAVAGGTPGRPFPLISPESLRPSTFLLDLQSEG